MKRQIAIAVVAGLSASYAHAETWVSTATGSNPPGAAPNERRWNIATNWDTGTSFPNAIGASAIFNGPTATRSIHYIDAITVGSLTVDNNTTASQTFTGSATAGGGSLTFDAADAGPATLTVNGTGGQTNTAGSVTIQSVSLTDDLVATVNQTNQASSAGGLQFTGEVGGAGGFTKAGPGLSTFSNAVKVYTGATNLTGGRFRMSLAGRPNATSGFTINGGQLTLISASTYTFGASAAVPLNLNGVGATSGPFAAFPGAIRNDTNLAATITNAVEFQSDTLIHVQGAATGSTTLSGAVGGAGKLTFTAVNSDANLGRLVLSNPANSYTGGTTVNGGTLDVTAGSLGATTGPLTVNVVPFGGAQTTVLLNTTVGTTTGSLSGARNGNPSTINNGGQLFTVNQAVPGTYDGNITGAGEFRLGSLSASTLTLTGNNDYTGGTTVNAGTLEVKKMHAGNAVTVAAGATLRVLPSAPAGSDPQSGDNAFVSQPSALTVDPAGFLDITNNDVIIDYSGVSPVATYEALVRSAYNVTGDWQGPGITSSIAANDGNYVVAIADNATLSAPFGTAQGGPLFAGVDVDLDTVLIKFTHRADLNLDGVVTPDDSAIFGGNYDESITSGHTWALGDMNYDGASTPDDAAIFGGAYDESLASLPEPSSLAALGLLGLGLARRRRRA